MAIRVLPEKFERERNRLISRLSEDALFEYPRERLQSTFEQVP